MIKKALACAVAAHSLFSVSALAQEAPPLDRLNLPPGFSVSLVAMVENARQLAVGDNGTIYAGSRRAGKVHAILDADGDFVGDEVVLLAKDLNLPSGIAFRDGDLYVGAVSTVYRFENIAANLGNATPAVVTDALPSERHHGWKYLKFGPDGMLYMPVGAPCNICDREEPFATIVRMDVSAPESTEIVARGVRNSVGFDWDPASDDLWFTDNGRDHLGDELPPCELNHVTELGQHFGYPYVHGNDIADPEFGENGGELSSYTRPALTLGAHVAPVGMTFYRGSALPERYRGDVLLAEHGSWNRSQEAGPVGYRLMHAEKDADGNLGYEVFVDGWLNDDGTRWGRPADILELPDGSLLIADDEAGAIYRLSYSEELAVTP
ncbi:MAG: PQQ-dependent sugar dehydrogenase [Pseudomonadota bacterium]